MVLDSSHQKQEESRSKASEQETRMDRLCNSFSVLELADEDDAKSPPAPSSSSTSTSGDPTSNGNGSGCVGEVKPERPVRQESVSPAVGYKMPLVWIDLEMTGLNIETDRILEIACIITDGSLNKLVEGPDLVIHQSKECMEKMGEWCQTTHAASGLTKKVLNSKISEREAETQVIEFVKKNVGAYTPHLAGNSIYVDFHFLKKYMPDLASLFSHVLVDVSSIKALCVRWYPKVHKKAPQKENRHRALDDIRESIAELKYYKEHMFRAKLKSSG